MDTHQLVQRLIFSYFPHTPTQGQQEACELLSEFLFDPDPHSAFMLKGYAGTGKTSLVSAIIQSAPQLKIKTLLLAPTGRAAKVLSGYSHRKAYTIHKKIYTTVIDPSGNVHCVRAQNKHAYTLFIVDEASMIGTDSMEGALFGRRSLLEDLIEYVEEGSHCRLLFIGDTAQLPPVGSMESPALSVEYLQSISDLKIFDYELTEVVRQESQSGILHNATQIRDRISFMEDFDEVEMPLFDLGSHKDVVRLNGEDLEDTLNSEYSNFSQEDVVFVTRSNKRANQFNQEIRNRILYREEEINAGDYLMVVKNNYFWLDKDSDMGFIANGDIIEVLAVRNHQDLYGFHFVDIIARFIDYPDAPNLECKIMLETLHSESPSLTKDESQQLFSSVMEDYADVAIKSERLRMVRENPYFNALQVKFAYALTCHKTQGGQWATVFIDQGYMTDDLLNKEYLRWLYTAITRATHKVYLLNFQSSFFDEA
ncbi:MAG: AAA family ATPase [Bacteroidales bacterium]|nr:AAA family ATPase [Bacteroidales bacterium]